MLIRFARLILGTSVLLVALFSAIVLLAPSVAKQALNIWLAEQQMTLGCLDYQYQWPTRLLIKRACVDASHTRIQVNQAVYDWQSNELDIAILHVKIEPSPAQTATSDFSLPSLPSFIPSIRVQQVDIHHPSLAAPLQLSIKQKSPQQFRLENGWSLDLNYQPEKVSGKFSAGFDHIAPYLPHLRYLNIDKTEPSQPVHVDFVLSDSQLSAKLRIPEIWPFAVPVDNSLCHFTFKNQGEWQLKVDPADWVVSLDASNVAMSVLTEDCPAFERLAMLTIPKTLALKFPKPLHYSQGKLDIAQVQLQSFDKDSIQISVTDIVSQDFSQGSAELDVQLRPFHSLQGKGHIQLGWSAQGVSLTSDLFSFDADEISYQNAQVSQLRGSTRLNYSSSNELQVSAQLDIQTLSYSDVHATDMTLEINLGTGAANTWRLDGVISAAKIHGPNKIEVNGIEQPFSLSPTTADQFQLTSNTEVEDMSVMQVSLGPLAIEHALLWDQAEATFNGQHSVKLLDTVSIEIASNNQAIAASLPSHQGSLFTSVLQQVLPQLDITKGDISAQIAYQIPSATLSGEASVQGVTGRYDEYQFNQLNAQLPFEFNSAGLQLASNKVSINNIDVGIPIDKVFAQVSSKDGDIIFQDIRAELLGGNIGLKAFSLSPAMQKMLVQLRGIELDSIMAIQQQSGVQSNGIQISGSIQGDFPITLENWQPSIDQAKLNNQARGTLKITNNTAFNALKQQQPEIGAQLAMLEHLEIENLQGILDLKQDGQANISIQIKGLNPDFNQPVEFNYNHDQNLYMLLKSLRLADQISEKVENNLSHSGEG